MLLSLISIFSVYSQATFDTTFLVKSFDIFYASGSDEIDSNYIRLLRWEVKNDSSLSYKLYGHTDEVGSRKFNRKLSKDRVEKVWNFMMDSLNVNKESIMLNYYGEEEPRSTNKTEQGKGDNRRVTVSIYRIIKLRWIKGKVISSTDSSLFDGMIFLQGKEYRDSALIQKDGSFAIPGPDGAFVRLDAAARDHFFISKIQKITPEALRNSEVIELPRLAVEQRYVLPQFHFVGGQTTFLPRSYTSVRALTRTLQNSNICIIIEGHVNEPNVLPRKEGTFEFTLAKRRALKIFNLMTSSGIDSTRLNPIGLSNWYMAYPYATEEWEMELNRRVEIYIKKCEELFDFSQEDAIVPDKIGTTFRLYRSPKD